MIIEPRNPPRHRDRLFWNPAPRVFSGQIVHFPKKLEKFEFLINDPKSEIAMFVLFLIPGILKDTLVYISISGLTPIKSVPFLLISMVARLPGLWGSAYIGAHLQKKEYLTVSIISGIAPALFVVGLLTKDKIIEGLLRLRRSR